ncbi:4-(cytidine 5'-diphospho)-2-C-methyl-D-erythritol kinase [Pseudobacteroides cellulosolvens]|uniref:4-diphosphocytidyl-2-C-methyl-D-erythritol kinase n=1 Tax=Pseudobacteroides cellulosolvens ATCC 35603 = DSM 2933 TaxID=398512 RepID=A0A0L6JV76_9FIRM|nr:4-(cytidine 5'-diphospho)-2-C-methyl-D-erythritol kinase [Pseudobacteroides cellulosolvens]KNY29718.1 4-diphosphocytidyl-2-C-methyl-D-erythritol kinase [Pseudobacteroides cellulosolvens ATCC 35603 = DSM 2933]
MERVEYKARAKINLSLDVLRKREDGYHDLKMVMQTLGLHDLVSIEKTDSQIKIDCNSAYIPEGEGNIAYKAAKLIMDEYGIKTGININIKKMIPVAAGLAGGSSDAAAVLKGINSLYDLGASLDDLARLGKKIGADVPYCIFGGTMLAEGIGDTLTRLSPFDGVDIILVKPNIGVSTAFVYNNLKLEKVVDRPDTELIIQAVGNKNLKAVAANMKNVLETVTEVKYTIISEIKKRLLQNGAIGSMMSGSGPTVFGIFEDKLKAQKAYESMKNNRWDCILTQTINEEMQ